MFIANVFFKNLDFYIINQTGGIFINCGKNSIDRGGFEKMKKVNVSTALHTMITSHTMTERRHVGFTQTNMK